MTFRMCAFQIFFTVDPSLGRVDYSLLSDQTLMEMLIEGFDDETKKEYQDIDGSYLDVCTWSGVLCYDLQRVIEVEIDFTKMSGSLELWYVPPKLKYLCIRGGSKSKLTGSVDLTRLPRGIVMIDLQNNMFTGEIDLTKLPNGMTDLELNGNQLTGEIDLTRLPEGMISLFLNHNQLTGEIDLTQLPDEMTCLILTSNQLTGGIDLTQLPDKMDCLCLINNQFSGEIDLTELPDGMCALFLSKNKLTGGIDLRFLPYEMVRLYLDNNQFSGEVDFKHLLDKMVHFSLENNQLSGSFDIRVLTNGGVINAQGNQFNAVAVVGSNVRATIKLRGSGVTSVVDEIWREQDMKRFLK